MKLNEEQIRKIFNLVNSDSLYRCGSGVDLSYILEGAVFNKKVSEKEIKRHIVKYNKKIVKNFYSDIQIINEIKEILDID